MERKIIAENPIMGESHELTSEEKDTLANLINLCPLLAFQLINKKMNANGFCCAIGSLDQGGNA